MAENSFKIGRNTLNQIIINDNRVGSFHAVLHENNRSWVIEDCNSTNHTFVNENQVRKCVIKTGDIIRFGPIKLTFDELVKLTQNDGSVIDPVEKLRIAYDDYKESLKKIKWHSQGKPRLIQLLISLVPTLISILFWDKLGTGPLKYILIGITTLGAGFAQIYSMSNQRIEKKVEKIRIKFMLEYKCPKCNNYLGEIPFNVLIHEGHCPRCRKSIK